VGLELPLVRELIRQVYRAGGIPFVTIKDRALLLGATLEQIRLMARYEAARMRDMDAYIGIRSGDNAAELSDVPPDKMELYQKYF
jgi:aminopeptidase